MQSGSRTCSRSCKRPRSSATIWRKTAALMLKKYSAIRMKRGLAIVAVHDGTCRGCNMRIPPQLYNIIQRGASPGNLPKLQPDDLLGQAAGRSRRNRVARALRQAGDVSTLPERLRKSGSCHGNLRSQQFKLDSAPTRWPKGRPKTAAYDEGKARRFMQGSPYGSSLKMCPRSKSA